MAKILGLLLVVGALAAAVVWVPIDGRTVLQRWQKAPSASEFAARAWGEVAVATGLREAQGKRPAAKQRSAATAARATPVERHTDADRAALERIVSEHAQK